MQSSPTLQEQTPRPRIAAKLVATALVLGLIGLVAGLGTWSAFTSTTSNSGNSFSAGTVTLTDNDGGSTALLTLTAAKPADSDEGCITVTYSGTLPSTVKLYGSSSFTSASSLAPYLNLTITRGSFASAPAFDSCTGFSADATNYVGAGNGVVYSGTLAAFNTSHSSFTNGLTDPTSGSPEVWSNPESHVYKISVSVADNNSAQGLNVTEAFTWEAQNN